MLSLNRIINIYNTNKSTDVSFHLTKIILQNLTNIEALTLDDFLKLVTASRSTVNRFFQSLGYHGFHLFKRELLEEIKIYHNYFDSFTYASTTELINHPIIDEYQKLITDENIQKTVTLLKKAHRIIIYGDLLELRHFEELQLFLLLNSIDTLLIKQADIEDQKKLISTLDKNDLLILVSSFEPLKNCLDLYMSHSGTLNNIYDYLHKGLFIGQKSRFHMEKFNALMLPITSQAYEYTLILTNLLTKIIIAYKQSIKKWI